MNDLRATAAMRGDFGYRKVTLAERSVVCTSRPDGTILLESGVPLGPVQRNLCNYLKIWAEHSPDRTFLCERVGAWRPGQLRPWRTVSYREAYSLVQRIAQSLLDRSLNQDTPILVLSSNSIEHALLCLAGMAVGVPVAPISPAYSLLSQDLTKIRYVTELLSPAVVFAQNGEEYSRAIAAVTEASKTPVEVIAVTRPPTSSATSFESLFSTEETDAVERAWSAVGPSAVAKILLTSGSTGMPKGVPNTHGMMCANQAMLEWATPGSPDSPPIVLDWLPWNHTFGGNLVFNTVLRQGGTLYIDGGRPLPEAFGESLENLAEVRPTHMWNVPTAYSLLATALEQDSQLRSKYFSRLSLLFYGGAGLPQSVWDRLQSLAVAEIGQKIVFTTGFGSTETGPMATLLHWPVDGPGRVGLPMPGAIIKLSPADDRYEIRMKGPMVFPGYIGRPDLTAEAFDEEGFYRIGDAGNLVDSRNPAEGIKPDGRIVEDFKLQTGSFVRVGRLRMRLLSLVPEIQDAVVAGHDKPFIGLLAWPNIVNCRKLGVSESADLEELIRKPEVIARIVEGIKRYNSAASGSSELIRRVILLGTPPSVDANEMTDKGYINQRAVLLKRSEAVNRLFSESPGSDVICIEEQ